MPARTRRDPPKSANNTVRSMRIQWIVELGTPYYVFMRGVEKVMEQFKGLTSIHGDEAIFQTLFPPPLKYTRIQKKSCTSSFGIVIILDCCFTLSALVTLKENM